jgi:RNA polymerase sigma factor (sigma-70 family)
MFSELMARLRAGDESAAADLVHQFEPEVRRVVRTWIRRQRLVLGRVLDSADICQSVLARFFVHVAGDRLELESLDHLRNLLLVMARQRLLMHARRNRAACRDLRRTIPLLPDAVAGPVDPHTPYDQAAERELLDRVRAEFTPEEHELADRRARGQSWAEIVADMGGTAAGRRMQLCRAGTRVARRVGLEAEVHVA